MYPIFVSQMQCEIFCHFDLSFPSIFWEGFVKSAYNYDNLSFIVLISMYVNVKLLVIV